jgi:hypothetical protein
MSSRDYIARDHCERAADRRETEMTKLRAQKTIVAFLPAWTDRLTRRSEAEVRGSPSGHGLPVEVEDCALRKSNRCVEQNADRRVSRIGNLRQCRHYASEPRSQRRLKFYQTANRGDRTRGLPVDPASSSPSRCSHASSAACSWKS